MLATAAPLLEAARTVQQGVEAVQAASSLVDRARALLDEPAPRAAAPRLELVHYYFRVADGPDPAWHVRHVSLTERLGEPYELVLEVLTHAVRTDPDELLGASSVLEIERGDLLRSVAGIITRIDDLGVDKDRLHLRLHVVPALALLAQRVDTRIFQDATVPEILAAVLDPELALLEREVSYELTRTDYERRDYCLQYHESDLDFARRLMAEEGIVFFFAFDEEKGCERLVLVDGNAALPVVPLLADETVPIIEARAEIADVESLRNFDWCQSQSTNQVTVRRFNWKDPTTVLEATATAAEPVRGRLREVYVHDDRRKIVDAANDPGFDGTALFEHEAEAPRRLERCLRDTGRGVGRSNVTGFAAGSTFVLADHVRESLVEQRFVLTRVLHVGDCPDESLDAISEVPRYENRFECIPETAPFRPTPATAKPRVRGPQTATVTGPPDEEIHVDAHGRIKVEFHWDRRSAGDDSSSCWVRVAQSSAGMGWGTVFTPRVGMEVVVSFLDGDPDQPLVTGCVYNGRNTHAYTLPDEKTKSVMRTQSSPATGGYNEITFEDLAGAEQIIVHAERDLNSAVGHDHRASVTRNQSLSVGAEQTISVGGSQRSTITGEQTTVVKGGLAALDVTGNVRTTATDTALLTAPNKITLACQGSSITLEPTKITIVAGGGATIVLDAEALVTALGGAVGLFNADVELTAKEKGHLLLRDFAVVDGKAGGYVRLDEHARLHGNGGGEVLCTADVACSGATATISGKTASAAFTGDVAISGANVTVSGTAKVEIGAPEVTSAAGTTNTISGATVNIN